MSTKDLFWLIYFSGVLFSLFALIGFELKARKKGETFLDLKKHFPHAAVFVLMSWTFWIIYVLDLFNERLKK